jgi:hypothetical protein
VSTFPPDQCITISFLSKFLFKNVQVLWNTVAVKVMVKVDRNQQPLKKSTDDINRAEDR